MATKPHNEATQETGEQIPDGSELRGNLSAPRLGQRAPGIENSAGALAVRLQRSILCGWVTGTVWAESPEPSQYKDQNGKPVVNHRMMGEFYALNHEREEITATDMFLPPVAERFVLAALKMRAGVPIAFEFWCSPNATAIRGYEYRTFLRQPPGQISAAKRMAIAAGIIPAPEGYVPELASLEPPSAVHALPGPEYDSETGEIAAEEARTKDGLDKLFEARAAE